MTDETASTPPADTPAKEGGERVAVQIDDATAMACYANFCRVSSTPEELVLDVGLNPNPLGNQAMSIKVTQRIIMNHYTAKRLLSVLANAVQRHEQTFGTIETDVQRRVKRS